MKTDAKQDQTVEFPTLNLHEKTLTRVELVYASPSPAQEKAMKWKQMGMVSIRITPCSGKYVLTAMATDAQISTLSPTDKKLAKIG